jgi:hypothetical protein
MSHDRNAMFDIYYFWVLAFLVGFIGGCMLWVFYKGGNDK